MPTQSKIGWRPYVNPSITASSLWTSIYSVYNADAIGSTSLKTSLFAAYNGESNTNDSKGTNNGTAQGGLTYGTGKIGNAFNFNGYTSYVDMGDVMDVGTSSWSYSFWFNPSQAFITGTLFGKTIAAGVRGRFYSQVDNYKLSIGFDADATNVIIVETPASSIIANNWYHAVIQIDRTDKVKLYLNGSPVTLTTTNGTNNLVPYSATNYNTNNPFRIGAYTNADNTTPSGLYSGKIDAFNIYNRVLTQSEITELYNSGNGAQYITNDFYKPTTNDALLVNNGTAQGGLTYGLGKVGTAFVGNGTNAYVSLPNNMFNTLTGDFTISVWANLTSLSSIQSILSSYYNAGGNYGFGLFAGYPSNNLRLSIYTAGTTLYVDTPITGSENTWKNYVITHKSGTNYKVYVNGVLTTTTNSITNPRFYTTMKNSTGAELDNSGVASLFLSNGSKLDAVNVWNKELSTAEVTELYNSGNGKQYVSSLDSDAQAFIASAAITVTTQQTAINTLVTDLKAANIWTKMKAIYPFVGGTAEQHRFNLKDPRTVNAAFYLAFNGGGLHSVTGYKPNGTTTYVDTFFNPSVNLSNATSNNHMSLYIRENIDEAKADMGCFTVTPFGVAFDIESRISGNAYYQNFRADNYITFASTDSRGLHINTRTSSNLQKVFINSTLKGTDTVTATNNINANISIAARYNNQNNAYEYRSSKEIAFSSIGDGLTDAEATAFYTAVQKYQTTLGRQV